MGIGVPAGGISMNVVQWNNHYNIGVEVIDKAHRHLFSIIDKLISLNEDISKREHACREGIKFFKNYTLKHFAEEEAYMQSIGYSEYEMHKRLHDNLRDNTLPALEHELEEQNYSEDAVHHFLGICVGWLNGHILIEDFAISGKVSTKWIHHASDDAIVSLEKSILQSFQQLYHAKAELVSKHYKGENFSCDKALCYRLTYLSDDNKKTQIYFLYEEQLILRLLGAMLGKQLPRIDQTIVYAIRELSQKFMKCISCHFLLDENFHLQKIDMMTFDQLVRTFDKDYPPYSLLFNVEKKGYFAFCVR